MTIYNRLEQIMEEDDAKIKLTKLASWLCAIVHEDCDNCPATNYCRVHHTGWLDVLEMDEDDWWKGWYD